MSGIDVLIIIIVLAIVFLIYFYFRNRVRKKALEETYGRVPSHVELYFEEYFEDIISNWDLLRKKEVNDWADDMNTRLNSVAENINNLKQKKDIIDSEFDSVENRIEMMEKEWKKERKR
ncbi:MAG: hypothetical protein R6W73_02540 [Candidatus Saliniplasma sp.]